MANGTYGSGGVANYESISSIYGMSMDSSGKICYVPERFPDNWYRRSYPYGVAQLVAGLLPTYLTGPPLTLPNPLGILQNGAQLPQIGCALYQGLTSGVPASLAGETNEFISEAVTYVSRRLQPIFPVSLVDMSPRYQVGTQLTISRCTAAVRHSLRCSRTAAVAGSTPPVAEVRRATARSAPRGIQCMWHLVTWIF